MIWIRVRRLRPSNDRSWVNDNSRNSTIDFEGDIAKIKNIRDFNWRTTRDYDEKWIDEEYRPKQGRFYLVNVGIF